MNDDMKHVLEPYSSEVIDQTLHNGNRENPFLGLGIEGLQMLTEALFMFFANGKRVGYNQSEVFRIAELPEKEKLEALRTLRPSTNGRELTNLEHSIACLLDDLILDAMAVRESEEMAEKVIPTIEDYLKNQ
jgi:hypothetical protein